MPNTDSNYLIETAPVHVVVVRTTQTDIGKELRVRWVGRKDGYLLLDVIELENDACSKTMATMTTMSTGKHNNSNQTLT
jgi:hypothetical protein